MLGGDSEVTRYKTTSINPDKDDYFQYLGSEDGGDLIRKEDAVERIMLTTKSGYSEALRLYNELTESGDKFKVNRSINVRAIQNSIDNIFQWIPGERILDPEFGSRLRYYLHEGITELNQEKIASEIRSSLARYDPRVSVDRIVNRSTLDDTENNTIVLDIEYHIKGLPDKIFNKQYIFNNSSN